MGKRRWEYLYGINPVFEAILSGRRRIYELFVGEKSLNNPRIKKLLEVAERTDVKVSFVSRERLFQLSTSRDNQGAVLKVSPYPYARFQEVTECSRVLLMDNVEDPHNVGAMVRTAEVLGFDAILLPDKGVPEVYPSVVNVSAGATEHMKIVREMHSNRYVTHLKEKGFTVVSLDAKGNVPITAGELKREKVLLVVGGEDKGVGQFILNNSDFVAFIPQRGRVNSLNASVAAAISMFSLTDG